MLKHISKNSLLFLFNKSCKYLKIKKSYSCIIKILNEFSGDNPYN